MRSLIYTAMLTALAGPVLAQPAVPITPQGVPPGANPETGARPGNEIGTGSSVPHSGHHANISPSDTRSQIAPNLPTPAIGDDAAPSDYLRAAQEALQRGRTGEAQQSLEMAQTRLLDEHQADNRAVDQIRSALKALADGDREGTLQQIESAMSYASAD